MRFQGMHRTTYTYSSPVVLSHHLVRLRPKSDPGQVLDQYSIDLDPAPAGVTGGTDAWGNSVTWAWFQGEHEQLEITTRFVVERLRVNPFDFIVHSVEGPMIPPVYLPDEYNALEPFMHRRDLDQSVRTLAESTVSRSGNDIIEFLGHLVEAIHERCQMIVRPEGSPWPAHETLSAGEGSCRDLAVLFIDACRHVGIAARFVSGYVAERPEGQPRELHAWAGVYVPGGGWRGYDPSQGLAVSTGHVTVATAAEPSGAAPVVGSFGAKGAESRLESLIELEVEAIEGNGQAEWT